MNYTFVFFDTHAFFKNMCFYLHETHMFMFIFQKTQFLQLIIHRAAGSHFGTFLAPGGSMAEPSRAGPGRAEPSRAEPGRADPSRAGPGRAEPEPSRYEPSRSGPGRARLGLGSGIVWDRDLELREIIII